MLPVTAFTLAGRVAEAARPGDAAGIPVAGGTTVRLSVLSHIAREDGSGAASTLGPSAAPVIVHRADTLLSVSSSACPWSPARGSSSIGFPEIRSGGGQRPRRSGP
ncbi:MAG: hypothetical protein HIU86_13015 [Acidobacteria bacterium]|nr:hypothetical protein [Acidobacteriota bacterium]